VRKRAKILVVLLLVVAGGALAYAGAAPEGYKNVSDVQDPALAGKTVEVKASVVPGSVERNSTPLTFRIADGSREMPVRWDPAVPLPDQEAGGTIEGKNVVVRGVVGFDADGRAFLLASEMKVGCASKYRAV